MIAHHNNITGVNFIITSTTFYAPAVTFSINGNIMFLKDLNEGFKKQILGITIDLK